MLAGKPIVVLPQQLEHWDNGLCVEAAGLGICLPMEKTTEAEIINALRTVLAPSFCHAARRAANRFKGLNPLATAYKTIQHFLEAL